MQVERIQVKANTRMIKANWSIDMGDDLRFVIPDTTVKCCQETLGGFPCNVAIIGLGCAIDEITSWCTDNIGDDVWYKIHRKIYFMDTAAYTMFMLRWA